MKTRLVHMLSNYGIGLELVDIGLNIPTINDFERNSDENNDPDYFWGRNEALRINTQFFYVDISVVGNKVVAISDDLDWINGTHINTLEIFRPDLAGEPSGIVRLSNRPNKLTTVEDFPVFFEGDNETRLYDLAFVTGYDGGVFIVEIPDEGSENPYNLNVYKNLISTHDGFFTKNIEVDRDARIAYVAATSEGSSDQLLVVDVSQPFNASEDINNDGWDDRIIGRIPVRIPGYLGNVYLQGFRAGY